VNAYVNPRFGPFALTGLEFICRAERQTLGFATRPYIKLSFPLLQAETITSLVFGAEPTNGHFAITVSIPCLCHTTDELADCDDSSLQT
jgi:hypothetical protein